MSVLTKLERDYYFNSRKGKESQIKMGRNNKIDYNSFKSMKEQMTNNSNNNTNLFFPTHNTIQSVPLNFSNNTGITHFKYLRNNKFSDYPISLNNNYTISRYNLNLRNNDSIRPYLSKNEKTELIKKYANSQYYSDLFQFDKIYDNKNISNYTFSKPVDNQNFTVSQNGKLIYQYENISPEEIKQKTHEILKLENQYRPQTVKHTNKQRNIEDVNRSLHEEIIPLTKKEKKREKSSSLPSQKKNLSKSKKKRNNDLSVDNKHKFTQPSKKRDEEDEAKNNKPKIIKRPKTVGKEKKASKQIEKRINSNHQFSKSKNNNLLNKSLLKKRANSFKNETENPLTDRQDNKWKSKYKGAKKEMEEIKSKINKVQSNIKLLEIRLDAVKGNQANYNKIMDNNNTIKSNNKELKKKFKLSETIRKKQSELIDLLSKEIKNMNEKIYFLHK